MRALLAFLLIGLVLGPASAAQIPVPAQRPPVADVAAEVTHGRVFLLRGLINVFSRGMDRLARKMEARGVPARATNFTHWREFAVLLLNQYRTDKSIPPVIIIGHSLGADAAIDMGNFLASNGLPVRLVVTFDGVHAGHKIDKGVEEIINYYLPDGYGQTVAAGPSFNGILVNKDLSGVEEIGHLNIDKSTALHEEVLAKVTGIFAESR